MISLALLGELPGSEGPADAFGLIRAKYWAGSLALERQYRGYSPRLPCCRAGRFPPGADCLGNIYYRPSRCQPEPQGEQLGSPPRWVGVTRTPEGDLGRAGASRVPGRDDRRGNQCGATPEQGWWAPGEPIEGPREGLTTLAAGPTVSHAKRLIADIQRIFSGYSIVALLGQQGLGREAATAMVWRPVRKSGMG